MDYQVKNVAHMTSFRFIQCSTNSRVVTSQRIFNPVALFVYSWFELNFKLTTFVCRCTRIIMFSVLYRFQTGIFINSIFAIYIFSVQTLNNNIFLTDGTQNSGLFQQHCFVLVVKISRKN